MLRTNNFSTNPYSSRNMSTGNQNNNKMGMNCGRPLDRPFSQLPVPIRKVFQYLWEAGLKYPLNPKSIPNPVPSHWNLNERCEYHQGVGHTMDNCITLHHTIQDLIDSKKISNPSTPNVARNPLPNHHINAIEEGDGLPYPVT